MAKLKKNAMNQIMFPMVDSTDFATIESAITASDFNSGATKKCFGVNHGGSAAFTSGAISKATTLVTSGIFQQTLKANECNYDYLTFVFRKTGCADQILIFETNDDISSQLSDVNSNLLSYLLGMSGMLSDVDSQVLLNASMISDVESQVNINSSDIDSILSDQYAFDGVLSNLVSLVSDIDSQILLNASMISDIQSQIDSGITVGVSSISDIGSRVWADSGVAIVATSAYLSDVYSDLLSAIGEVTASVGASDMSDIASRVWATTEGTRVDSRILIIQSNLSDVDSALTLHDANISAAVSDAHSDLGSKIGNVSVTLTASDISDIASAVTAAGVNLTASDMSDISSRIWATTEGTRVDSRIFVLQSSVSDVDSQLTVNYDLISDVDSQVLLNASAISDVDSQVLLNASVLDSVFSVLSNLDSNFGSRVPKAVATNSQLSDLHSDLRSYATGMSDMLSDVDSQLTVNYDLISDVDSQVLLNASAISDVDSQLLLNASMISDIESQVDAGITIGASSLSDIYSQIWDTAETEIASMPAANAGYGDKVGMMFAALRNKRMTTASEDKIFDDAGTSNLGSAVLSDDGTTFERGEYS